MNSSSMVTMPMNVRAGAEKILAPLMRVLAALGLQKSELDELCSKHFKRALSGAAPRRLQLVRRDPRYADIITRWITSPDYHHAGAPARLRVFGKSPSFASLVREVQPALTPADVLKDWNRLGVVKKLRSGRVVLVRPFIPTRVGRMVDLEFFATLLADFLRAYELNFLRQFKPGGGLFQRQVVNFDVPRRLAPLFNDFARAQGALLIESIDDWLARHQDPPNKRRRKACRLGLGVYVVNDAIR